MMVTSMEVFPWEWDEMGRHLCGGYPTHLGDWHGCHQRPVRGLVSEEAERGSCFAVRWMHPLAGLNQWDVWGQHLPDDVLPDLTDEGTVGHLLGMVREAWDDHEAHCSLVGSGWRLWNRNCSKWADGRTEGEALVVALEMALEMASREKG